MKDNLHGDFALLPHPYAVRNATCSSMSIPCHTLAVPVSIAISTGRTFIHTAVHLWNSFPDNVVGNITDSDSAEPLNRSACKYTTKERHNLVMIGCPLNIASGTDGQNYNSQFLNCFGPLVQSGCGCIGVKLHKST